MSHKNLKDTKTTYPGCIPEDSKSKSTYTCCFPTHPNTTKPSPKSPTSKHLYYTKHLQPTSNLLLAPISNVDVFGVRRCAKFSNLWLLAVAVFVILGPVPSGSDISGVRYLSSDRGAPSWLCYIGSICIYIYIDFNAQYIYIYV